MKKPSAIRMRAPKRPRKLARTGVPGTVTEAGDLTLPRGGLAALAKIAWADDQAQRREFLKSGMRRHSSNEISFEEFGLVHERVEFLHLTGQLAQANIYPLTRQLEQWGILLQAREWVWVRQAIIVKDANVGRLSLPWGGRVDLSEIAWPDDQATQLEFLKSGLGRTPLGRYPLSEISIDEFHRLQEVAGEQITQQLDEWGVLWARAAGVPITEKLERERRDAIFENFRLKAYISRKEANARAAWQKGSRKGGETRGLKSKPTHDWIFAFDKKQCDRKPGMSRTLRAKAIKIGLAQAAKDNPSLIALAQRTIENILSPSLKP
jgi:hypothetical protein